MDMAHSAAAYEKKPELQGSHKIRIFLSNCHGMGQAVYGFLLIFYLLIQTREGTTKDL